MLLLYLIILINTTSWVYTDSTPTRNDTHNYVLVNAHLNTSDILTLTSYQLEKDRGLHKSSVIRRNKGNNKITESLLAYLVIILIQTSNDINPNPGPDANIYPCGTCDQPVTWDDRSIVCYTCNQWYKCTIFRANPWALDPTMNLQMTAQLRGTVLCVDVQTIRHCAIHSSLAHQITTVSCQIPL